MLSADDADEASFVAADASFVAADASFVAGGAESIDETESIEGCAPVRAEGGSVALTSPSYLSNGAVPPCARDRWTYAHEASTMRGMRTRLARLTSRMPRMPRRRVSDPVTLVIYGWHESQPGTLAWVFPSMRAAQQAVRAMRNAVRWVILKGGLALDGDAAVDVEALRRAGGVLLER